MEFWDMYVGMIAQCHQVSTGCWVTTEWHGGCSYNVHTSLVH